MPVATSPIHLPFGGDATANALPITRTPTLLRSGRDLIVQPGTEIATVNGFYDNFNRPDGPLGNGWLDEGRRSTSFNPLEIHNGQVRIADPFSRQINDEPLSVGIGCAYRNMGSANSIITIRYPGNYAHPEHRVECSGLHNIMPGSGSFGMGAWISDFAGQGVLLIGTIGNPAQDFNVFAAATYTRDALPHTLTTMSINGFFSVMWDGVQLPIFYTDLPNRTVQAVPVPSELLGSPFHGFAIDTHYDAPNYNAPAVDWISIRTS